MYWNFFLFILKNKKSEKKLKKTMIIKKNQKTKGNNKSNSQNSQQLYWNIHSWCFFSSIFTTNVMNKKKEWECTTNQTILLYYNTLKMKMMSVKKDGC